MRSDNDDPLEVQDAAQLDSGHLILMERRSQALWTLALKAGSKPSRVTQGVGPNRSRLLRMASRDGRVALIDILGRITVDKPSAGDPRIVAHLAPGSRRGLLGFLWLPDESFLIAENGVSVVDSTPFPIDSVFITRIIPPDSLETQWKWERGGRARPLGLMTDYLTLRADGDTVTLSGTAPPRAISWSAHTPGSRREELLARLSPIQMSEVDRAPIEAELRRRSVPEKAIEEITRAYPVVADAKRRSVMNFVVSGTGANEFVLRGVCRENGAVHDLVAGNDVSRVFLLSELVIVVRDALDQGMMLIEVSRYEDFEYLCEAK